LQKYFGNKDAANVSSVNKKSGKVHPNFLINKLEKQYNNQSSKKVENFISSAALDDYLNSAASPVMAKHHPYLNMHSDT
jgi:hypothetical protein